MTDRAAERLAGCLKAYAIADGAGYIHAEFEYYAAALIYLKRLGGGYSLYRVADRKRLVRAWERPSSELGSKRTQAARWRGLR